MVAGGFVTAELVARPPSPQPAAWVRRMEQHPGSRGQRCAGRRWGAEGGWAATGRGASKTPSLLEAPAGAAIKTVALNAVASNAVAFKAVARNAIAPNAVAFQALALKAAPIKAVAIKALARKAAPIKAIATRALAAGPISPTRAGRLAELSPVGLRARRRPLPLACPSPSSSLAAGAAGRSTLPARTWLFLGLQTRGPRARAASLPSSPSP